MTIKAERQEKLKASLNPDYFSVTIWKGSARFDQLKREVRDEENSGLRLSLGFIDQISAACDRNASAPASAFAAAQCMTMNRDA
jgi:hypothetical protein